MIFNVYDLESVDDQHPHGKSVGKYLMVNRVRRVQATNLRSLVVTIWDENLGCRSIQRNLRSCYKNRIWTN